MDYTQDLEAPDTFHFWTGVSTIAGALRRKVWIDQLHFQWSPNFYIIFVAKAGIVGKTTTSEVGHGILAEVPDIYFGADVSSWQALLDEMAAAKQTITLPEGELYTSSSMTINLGELGTFLDPDDRKQIDVLTSLWDGKKGTWKKTLRSGNTFIEGPWINIIACTTPAWFSRHIPNYLLMSGIVSRMIIVRGEAKRKLTAYPGLVRPQPELLGLRGRLISDLIEISNLCGVYKLAPEAVEWGKAWYEAHWTKRPLHLTSEKFDGYIARKQTHIHKLAMVLAAAQSNDLLITQDILEHANRVISAVEVDLEQIFASVGSHDTLGAYHESLAIIRACGPIRGDHLWRRLVSSFDGNHESFEKVMNGLLAARHIKQTNLEGQIAFEAIKPN